MMDCSVAIATCLDNPVFHDFDSGVSLMSGAARRCCPTDSGINICCNYFVFGNIRIDTFPRSAHGDLP
ncbi:hypothetical protein BDI4_1390011 [Burkholderia diffusa]|nr:hypothetical protein BDI4_1390011 [Burkholderia diffusa]